MTILVGLSVLGFVFDEFFRSLKGFIVPLLVLIMLTMGLTLDTKDFRALVERPLIILYGALLQFTVMPLFGFTVAVAMDFDSLLLAGFVLVGSAPGGTASNLITYISRGDLAYSIAMTTASTLISPLFTPFWTWLLAGKYVPVPFFDMAVTTLKIVIMPVVLGMVIRKLLGKRVYNVESVLPFLAISSISFIIAVIFALNKEKLASLSLAVFSGVLVHNLGGFLVGFLAGKVLGLDNKRAKTLSIEIGMQNSGLSTVLAVKFFSPITALPSAIFSLSQNILGVLLSVLFRRL